MTKEQEQLAKLEREQEDYFYALEKLKNNEDIIPLGIKEMNIIRKAINLELILIDSEIRALKKKGVNNERFDKQKISTQSIKTNHAEV